MNNKDLPPISRRSFLAGASAIAVSAGLAGPLAAGQLPSMKSTSRSGLGEWILDRRNLPAYLFTADLPLQTTEATGKPYPLDHDPFFLIGNYRLTVFASASGLYRIVSGERGWTRLNEPLSGAEQNGASLEITRSGQKKVYELLGMSGMCAVGKSSRRQFGCGYVQYELTPDKDITVVRTLSLAPSDDKAMGQPALIVTVDISENGGYWFSLAGQMIIGLSTFDKVAAMSMLRMMTFDNFARHYPTYWTGLWSGPDTINAVPSGSIAGLPRPDNDGLWTTFASYCAHAHAWPIYAWSKIAEAE